MHNWKTVTQIILAIHHDHYPILISLDRKEVKKVNETFLGDRFLKGIYNQFINNCQQVDWKSILQINDAQQAFTTLHSQINDQFFRYAFR